MYIIAIDREQKRLNVTLQGFWPLAEMASFEREMTQSLQDLWRTGGARGCLVDASTYPVQSREVTERHQQFLSSLGDLAAERIALVVPGQLVKLQATRAAGDLQHQMFRSREAALAWLNEAV